MRLFTGLDLPPNIEGAIERLLAVLRPAAPELTWSPLANLHITTKFIGEWPEARLGELSDALRVVAKPDGGAPAIRVSGLGWFPDAQAPRALFAAVNSSPALPALASQIQDALAAIGVAREDREYRPHVTLARVPRKTSGSALDSLRRAAAEAGSLDFGSFEARAFHLYSSRTEPAGSIYTKLAEFPLQ
jgi:2'-5' RNA ligase